MRRSYTKLPIAVDQGGRVNWAKLAVWLSVMLFCFLFWLSAYSLLATEYRLELPPDRFNQVPETPPVIVFATLDQTDAQCRNASMTAIAPGQVCYGCAMQIVGGEHKDRSLTTVLSVKWGFQKSRPSN